MTHRKNSVALGPSPRGTLAWGSGSPIPFGGTMSADFTGSKACREEWFSCRVLGGLPDVDVIGPVALGPRSSSDRAGRDASRRCPFEALVPTDRNRGAQTIPRVASRPPRRNGVENGEARGTRFDGRTLSGSWDRDEGDRSRLGPGNRARLRRTWPSTTSTRVSRVARVVQCRSGGRRAPTAIHGPPSRIREEGTASFETDGTSICRTA